MSSTIFFCLKETKLKEIQLKVYKQTRRLLTCRAKKSRNTTDQELKDIIMVPLLPHVSALHISVWASFSGRFSHLSGTMSSPPPRSATLGLDPTNFKIQQKMLEDPGIPTKVLGMNFSNSGITFVGHMTVPVPTLSLAWRMFLLLFESKHLPGVRVRVELTFSEIT